MSKRRRPPKEESARAAGASASGAGAPAGGAGRGPLSGLPVQLGLLTALFAGTVGIAELAGAANLGVSLGIGQVVFALVLLVLLIRA